MSLATNDLQDKFSKVTDKLLIQESRCLKMQETIKEQYTKIEVLERESKKYKELGINNLIDTSSDIYDAILNLVLDDNSDNSKILAIQKSLSAFINNSLENDAGKVKDHCGTLLRSLLDTSKRLLHARNELKTQDQA